MYSSVERRLTRLLDADRGASLRGGLIGLEREALRVSPNGRVAHTPHPPALGKALTHPYITTDYSEALLELITPPLQDKRGVTRFLEDTHRFVYENLGEEILWANSMPCVLEGGGNIPIARYGNSNAGRMKTVYRRGLGHRYGRTMQVIAGVHFNFSLPETLWPLLRDLEGQEAPPREAIAESYMGMIRNLQRFGWLVPYLLGASPAVCKSFLGDKPTDLQDFDAYTYHYPYATSLRMGDIGYQNSLEEGRGFKANYDSLDAYIRSLTWAIQTPCPDNERIGVLVDGEYRQLNANVLQIENEHYSTIRPKQILDGMEKPTSALRRRGVRYVELRSVDVNPFHPLGVTDEELYFLETFVVFCFLCDSPRISPAERIAIDRNQILAAHRGREPGLELQHNARPVPLREWGRDLLLAMLPVAETLDGGEPATPFVAAVRRQIEAIDEPALTPSAKILEQMRANREGFFAFAQRLSLTHRAHFRAEPLSEDGRRFFAREAEAARERQAVMERDTRSFEQFLNDYFSQT